MKNKLDIKVFNSTGGAFEGERKKQRGRKTFEKRN